MQLLLSKDTMLSLDFHFLLFSSFYCKSLQVCLTMKNSTRKTFSKEVSVTPDNAQAQLTVGIAPSQFDSEDQTSVISECLISENQITDLSETLISVFVDNPNHSAFGYHHHQYLLDYHPHQHLLEY